MNVCPDSEPLALLWVFVLMLEAGFFGIILERYNDEIVNWLKKIEHNIVMREYYGDLAKGLYKPRKI